MSDRLLKESDVLRIAFQLPLVFNSAFADAVKALPSADRPQGEWIDIEPRLNRRRVNKYKRCSHCGFSWARPFDDNYCPNCGARMLKGADDA